MLFVRVNSPCTKTSVGYNPNEWVRMKFNVDRSRHSPKGRKAELFVCLKDGAMRIESIGT
jgi:hypothetical protein